MSTVALPDEALLCHELRSLLTAVQYSTRIRVPGSLRLLRCRLLQQTIEQRWSWNIEPGAVDSPTVPPSLTPRDAPGILRARDEFPLPGD